MGNKRAKIIAKKSKKRIIKKYGQKGGSCSLSASGSFDNVIGQLSCMVENGIESIVYGVKTAYSTITIPEDLEWDFDRPNEPLPSNTGIAKTIGNI